jgi:hypothetical protein
VSKTGVDRLNHRPGRELLAEPLPERPTGAIVRPGVGERDQLFLLTLSDLEARCSAETHEYDVMGIALLLRKLLLDADCLVDQVNRERRLKIRYVINDRPMPTEPIPLMWSMQDGFDPETAFRSFPKEVKKADLLARPVLAVNEFPIAVKDVIRYVAHVKGAVHAGEPKNDQERALIHMATAMQIGGFDPGVRSLLAIARVVLKGLRPLRELIEADSDATSRT